MAVRASFVNHKVTREGVYIRGITKEALFTADIEIFVTRDEAEMFGWIEPMEEFEFHYFHAGKVEADYTIEGMDREEAEAHFFKYRLEYEPYHVVPLSEDYQQYI